MHENINILIADDDQDIRKLLDIYLKNEGYHTLQARNGREALALLQEEEIHLIILDIMMPEMDGIETLMKVREKRNTPVIFLSAKSGDMDIIQGLSVGADDYLTKPFNPLELLARVKSQLRRYINFQGYGRKDTNEEVIRIEDLMINVSTHEVIIGDKVIKLTPREFDILTLLAKNQGMVFSSEKIYEQVWKETFYESENTVMVHIRKLREKLEENSRKPKYIKTVWGVGYKI